MRPLFADPKTDFVFKKLFGTEEHKPLLTSLLNGLACKEGLAQELEQGELKGLRASIRKILSKRGLAPNSQEDALLEACADVPTLERWLEQALTAPSAREALS